MTEQRNKRQFKPGKDVSIHWCPDCNLPLISIECALCGSTGERIDLGPPGDVRFCSPYECGILLDILTARYGIDPLGERIVLLNKIGGEDKTDQVIVDGLVFGILRFDLKILDWLFDLSMDGAAIMAQYTRHRTVELSDVPGHLSGKTVSSDVIQWCSDDIRQGDDIIVRHGKMIGCFGVGLLIVVFRWFSFSFFRFLSEIEWVRMFFNLSKSVWFI